MLRVEGWPINLSWSQFREIATRPRNASEDAQINPLANVGTLTADQGEFLGFQMYHVTGLVVTISINPESTWVVAGRRTPELLRHEQGHLDLLGLKARGMLQEIGRLRKPEEVELRAAVNRVIRDFQHRAQALDARYDRETDHGRNRSGQLRWNQQIQRAITAGGGI